VQGQRARCGESKGESARTDLADSAGQIVQGVGKIMEGIVMEPIVNPIVNGISGIGEALVPARLRQRAASRTRARVVKRRGLSGLRGTRVQGIPRPDEAAAEEGGGRELSEKDARAVFAAEMAEMAQARARAPVTRSPPRARRLCALGSPASRGCWCSHRFRR
jgi:hypothetical protein